MHSHGPGIAVPAVLALLALAPGTSFPWCALAGAPLAIPEVHGMEQGT